MDDERRAWPTFPVPSVMWADREGCQPLGATVWLRPVRMTHVERLFGDHGAIFVGVGEDGRPSMVSLYHGLSARAALHVVRLLAEGTRTEAEIHRPEELGFLPLGAQPALWAWLLTALGNVCARLVVLPDEDLRLPTAAA
jgi:hypothetical protein